MNAFETRAPTSSAVSGPKPPNSRKAEREFGGFGPLTAEDVGALVSNAFIGAESHYLLGLEKRGMPVRQALRRVGDLIRAAEASASGPRRR